MKRLLLPLLMCLTLCAPAWAANIFTLDPNCVANWNFEDGALTTDSKGGNTLTAGGTPAADTADYQEGAASVELQSAGSDTLSITDANLDAGYPLKNGDATKKTSIAFWFKMDSDPGSGHADILYSKYIATFGARSFLVYVYDEGATNKLGLNIGYNSGFSEEGAELPSATRPIATGVWYHVGVTHDDSTKGWRIRLWDSSNSTNYEATGTFTNNIYITTQPVVIGKENGAYWDYWNGNIDEMVVFKDILTADEIDEIRLGTYGAPAATGTSNWWWRRRHN